MLIYKYLKKPRKLRIKPRKCINCGKLESTHEYLLRCSGCYLVLYCSKRCQIRHWNFHKNVQCHPKYSSNKYYRGNWDEKYFMRRLRNRLKLQRTIIKQES